MAKDDLPARAVGLRALAQFPSNAARQCAGRSGAGVFIDARDEILGIRIVDVKTLHGAGIGDKGFPVIWIPMPQLAEILNDRPEFKAVTRREVKLLEGKRRGDVVKFVEGEEDGAARLVARCHCANCEIEEQSYEGPVDDEIGSS